MKLLTLALLSSLALAVHGRASSPATPAILLDENTVANLRLEYARAEKRVFEESVFALGRVEASHGALATVSSRVPGRVVELLAHLGDHVVPGALVARVESRAAGDPAAVVTLHAPAAGMIIDCEIHLGDPVEPDRHLMEIADLRQVDAVARLPESSLGRLRVGETEARIRLAAFPGEVFVGRLNRIAPAADPATGTVDVHFTLGNTDGRLRPGLRAEFSVLVSSRPNVLSLPREAVQGEGVGPRFIFLRDPSLPYAFLKRPVVLGANNDRWIEIVNGLRPGDEVVTSGAYSLAFAGGGTVSLKEALDAAHGHEHAPDGSELPHDKAHDHAHGVDDRHRHDHDHPDRIWQLATAVLALATLTLSLALARRRHA